jgi:hypothetical protein
MGHPERRTSGPATRRRFMIGLAGLGSMAAVTGQPRPGGTGADERRRGLVQVAEAEREPFMRRAFEMRALAQQRGDQPYGAVVVKPEEVLKALKDSGAA